VDFIRRPIQSVEAVQPPVNFNGEPSLVDMERLAEAPQAAPRAASSVAEILRERPNLKASTRPASPPMQPPVPIKSPNHSVIASTIVKRSIGLLPKAQLRLRVRPAAWFWRATLTFASMVLLALVLWFGMRQSDKPSAQRSGPVLAEKFAANAKTEGTANHASSEAQVAKSSAATAETSTANPPLATSSRRGDGLIARDTVTYFDKRTADQAAARTKPSKRFATHRPSANKSRGGVIAANSVTYFNYKPTPKTAKPDSSAKPGSARN
jgi:hypothetical protein